MVVGHQLVFHSRQLYWGDTRTPQRHLGEKKSEQKIDEKEKLVGVKELSLQVQWVSENRTFEIRIHSKSGRFEGRLLNGTISLDHFIST